MAEQKRDYYEVLGVSKTATEEEIKKLADSSKNTANDSDDNNNHIRASILQLVKQAEHLTEVAVEVNSRADDLALSTKDTGKSIETMRNVSRNVENSLKKLLTK